MKSTFIKSCCIVLIASIFCSTLFLTSCGLKNDGANNVTTENPIQTPENTESTNIPKPDIPNDSSTSDILTKPSETPEGDTGGNTTETGPVDTPQSLVAGLYTHDSKELLYSWNYLIKHGFITVKNSAITSVSNKLNGELRISNEITSISKKAFSGCTGISGIYIGPDVSYIGESAFLGCSGIKTLDMGNGVTKIGSYAFKNCTGLQTLIVGDRVTSIETGAFQNCTNLRYLIISDSVTFIGKSAFYGCTGLKVAYVGKNVTYIGESVFNGCTALEKIIFPCSVSYVGAKSFYNCNKLTNIAYEGIEADFGSITMGANNAPFNKKAAKYSTNINTEKNSLKHVIFELTSVEN